MNLHEYQAKNLFRRYNLPVPPYEVISSVEETERALQTLGIDEGVIKIQVHAGGRGKGGGVRICKGMEAFSQAVKELLGMKFSNNQTAGMALPVEKVLISPLSEIEKEYYVACVVDRKNQCPAIMVSSSGGMNIEDVLAHHPEQMLTIPVSYYGKVHSYQLKECAKFLGWEGKVAEQGTNLLKNLVQVFIENDASLLEINPLVLTKSNELLILDAKVSIDDNALYRHPILSSYYDPSQENVRDVMAKQIGLSYIALDGSIGCLVNGAGLAMSTLDILQFYGGNAANFLDVGGGASENQVREAVSLVLSDEKVKVLFVNIFGGIMDCAVIASGLAAVVGQGDHSNIPVVIRMEGTNVELGKTILQEAGLNLHYVKTIDEGAELAVRLSK